MAGTTGGVEDLNLYLLWIVTACYGGTGVQFALRGQYAWAVFWTCYAIANVAFMLAKQ